MPAAISSRRAMVPASRPSRPSTACLTPTVTASARRRCWWRAARTRSANTARTRSIFGPDGDVYWMIGNFGGIEAAFSPAVAVRECRRGAVAAGDGRCPRSRQPGACPGRVHLADATGRRPRQHRSVDDTRDRTRGRRLPQRLRRRVQPCRRTLHVRLRHGVGHQPALVPPGAHAAPDSGRGFRLPPWIRPVPDGLPGHAAVDVRTGSRLPGGRDLLSGRGVPGRVSRCVPCR